MTKRNRTAIVGLGITGMSCVRYLHATDELIVVDTREAPPGLVELEADYPDVVVHVGARRFDVGEVDRVLVSPGIGLDDPILDEMPEDTPVVSDIDLFCAAATAPIIAVTGTNGKSTVTSLAGHILKAAGFKAVVGGNLGDAALDLLDDEVDVYVLELSSFQLERLAPQRFKAATILNVSEDHLDRHGDMDHYTRSKQRIYSEAEVCVANRGDPATYPASPGVLVTFGDDEPNEGDWGIRMVSGARWLARGEEALLPSDVLPVAGRHNELNTLAAMALVNVLGVDGLSAAEAVRSFEGLAHRCQRVRVRREVEFIDDSKATNVGATRAALIGLGDADVPRIVLIAGGDGKGADFTVLEDVVRCFVKSLILLGRDAPLLAEALSEAAEIHLVSDMTEAVERAAELAGPGDLVLLSPACASLDMYVNFAARGEDFARSVGALAA
jgi:UDP-N-acetylmuramoylalanine--D-glutamate ligase